jgi:intracellular sulfur oxidation DsrE/DsrF family protein
MNGRTPHPIDEDIHRFIDGELSGEERHRMLERIESDQDVAARLQELRMVNDGLRHAFDDVQPPPRSRSRSSGQGAWRRAAAAAALFLPVGFLVGWLTAAIDEPRSVADELLAGGLSVGTDVVASKNAMFHIDVNDPAAFAATLDKAEALLETYKRAGARVEVVANSKGLDMLREDTSPLADRVHEMLDHYDNLTLVACVNTVRRLRDRGIEVRLFDETQADISAVEHVARRLQEGWTYVKI